MNQPAVNLDNQRVLDQPKPRIVSWVTNPPQVVIRHDDQVVIKGICQDMINDPIIQNLSAQDLWSLAARYGFITGREWFS